MKAKVDKDTCTGCSACVDSCPDVFRMDDDDTASVYVDQVPGDQEECAKEAADDCPVEAITIE